MTNIREISEIRTAFNGLGSTMKFTNLLFVALRMLLLFEVTSRVSGIQNDQTSSRSPQDNMILSASAYTGPEKTSNFDLHNDKSFRFDRTMPAFQLESSKSVMDDIKPNEETKFVFDGMSDEIIDGLTSSKHIDQFDGNNIEVKPGEYYHIAATKSETFSGEGQGAPQGRDLSTEPRQPVQASMDHPAQIFHMMDQERQARQETPQIYSEHAPPPVIRASSGRQANPDIQDIITGIVKLLNGNVNVAANTVRPLRPVQATRINNRGPPRIADVPPLPIDFDTTGMNPPPPPDQPYPFEKPPAPDRTTINQINNQLSSERPIKPFLDGIPVPEQIVPQDNRIWTRPYNRPGGTRRPIPPYKPLPPLDSSFHREGNKQPEKSPGDLTTTEIQQDVGESSSNKVENHQHSQETTLVNAESVNHKEVNYTNKVNDSNKENQTPSIDSAITKQTELEPSTKDQVVSSQTIDQKTVDYPKPVIPLISSTETISILQQSIETSKGPTIIDISPTKSGTSTSKVFSTTTLKIETSSSVQVIEPTSTKSSSAVSSSTIALKNGSTKMEVSAPDSTSLLPSPTEKLENTPSVTSSISTPALPVSTSFTQTSASISNTIDKSIKYTTSSTFSKKYTGSTDIYSYRPRPGIVLDDTLDYTGSQGLATQRPYGPQRHPPIGDIFDVTVSAIQGPGSAGNSIEGVRIPVHTGGTDVILTSAIEGQGFVSIDGKRTYLNLFDTTDRSSGVTQVQPQPTRTQHPPIIGTGVAVPQPDVPSLPNSRPSGGPIRRPIFHRRPTQPPVRIDTCIVGDTSTCDASQHEACATVQGVSACHCKPGYARLQHSLPCKKIVSIVVSMRVDRIYEEKRKVVWNEELADKDSELYQTLAYEANRAIESAMSMTPFSDEYMGSVINNIYEGDISQGQGGVFVNTTLKLLYEPRTMRPSLAGELQRHLRGVIERRNNNIGKSALYVDSPPGSISNLQDLDECASSELNDCHSLATCTNSWGGFTCACNPGFKDPHKDDPNDSGRTCLSCPSTYCNNRGSCSYQNDQMQCTCAGNYYGAQCEVDGEVLGVAIGASVAALIIIVLTLVGLIMWSRRWSREQKAMGSPVYGYIQGGIHGTLPGTLARVGSVGTLASVKQGPPTNLPPYMWAHFTDHMATANVYATEPMGPTRPSSAIFGYPPMNVHGTLPPVPLPRLQAPPRPRQRQQPDPDSSDSELQDKDRADLIPQNNAFHVPRPKSRSSLANQSGIYNDVEYDQGDVQHLSKNNIPLSTYRPYYRT